MKGLERVGGGGERERQLLAAVTQLQHTVESYEKKLESEAAVCTFSNVLCMVTLHSKENFCQAQNAQILSLGTKLDIYINPKPKPLNPKP